MGIKTNLDRKSYKNRRRGTVMYKKIKLGLTRNRLFEFCNCVSFVGRVEDDFDENELKKALKMLFLKYPIISSKTELSKEDGEAYVVLGSVNPKIDFVEASCDYFVSRKISDGIDFTDKNFEFYVLNNSTLCVFAHTTVADNYFLMILATELIRFYNKETVSVEECPVCLFSEMSSIPVTAFSLVTDKLASELQLKWLRKPVSFSVDDYKKARANYYNDEGKESFIKFTIDGDTLNKIKAFSKNNKTDISTVVAFCYYDSLCKNNIGNKKHKKIYFQTNRRAVLADPSDYIQGAHNGLLEVFTDSKKKTKPFNERLKAFHQKTYKAFGSVGSNFEKDFFSMKLSPSFCDSAYMCRAGVVKSKISTKLSQNHLCGVGEAGEFAFVNYSQGYWQGLKCFEEVVSSEPLKTRTLTFLQFDFDEDCARFVLKYRDKIVSKEKAENILDDLMKSIKNLNC